MKTLLFSLRDDKDQSFGPLLLAPSVDFLKRELGNYMIETPDSVLSCYTQDFQLFYIAEYESETGEMITPVAPVYECTLVSIKDSLTTISIEDEN